MLGPMRAWMEEGRAAIGILHGLDGLRDDAQRRPTPAGVRHTDGRARRVVEEQGYAIGEAQQQWQIRLIGDEGVSLWHLAIRAGWRIQLQHIRAMDKPERANTRAFQAEMSEQAVAVFGDGLRRIADGCAQIQRLPGSRAHAAMSREDAVPKRRPCRVAIIDQPIGLRPLQLLRS